MNPEDLLKPECLTPLWRSAALALLLWLLVWWRERPAKSTLPLAVMAAAWVGCHRFVNPHSGQLATEQSKSEDWLVIGACGVGVVAVAAWFFRRRTIPTGTLTAVLLLAAAWLAFRQMPYLLERGESPEQRLKLTGMGLALLVPGFLAAEWCARRVSPLSLMAGFACFAALAGMALLRMKPPDPSVVLRPLAVAAVAVAGALAAGFRRERAAVPRGLAGWFAGGLLVFVIFGCLSRASHVPLEPMAAAAGVLPVAALVLAAHRRLFIAGHGLTFVAAVLLGSSAILFTAARHQSALETAPPPVESTGADDTGAYD